MASDWKFADHQIKCFLQVNISEEASKHGFRLSEVDKALEEIQHFDKIKVIGLMTMAPIDASEQELTDIFQKANALRKNLKERKLKNMPFDDLSMGMSGDFPIAIRNGSTFVRIGSAFFK